MCWVSFTCTPAIRTHLKGLTVILRMIIAKALSKKSVIEVHKCPRSMDIGRSAKQLGLQIPIHSIRMSFATIEVGIASIEIIT